jgi:hypothetical protein
MAVVNPGIIDEGARATIRAQTQTATGLDIPVFSGVKPYSIRADQWMQRVDSSVAT